MSYSRGRRITALELGATTISQGGGKVEATMDSPGVHELESLCFELTDLCPLACGHCSVSAGPGRDQVLPFGVFQRLVDEFREKGCTEIVLAGGEPFALDDFDSYASYANRRGAAVSVYTSGNIFGGRGGKSIAGSTFAHYRHSGVTRLVFSVYAAEARVHELITHVSGSFDATCDSVKSAKAVGLECEFNFVPMKPNWSHLIPVLQLGARLNIGKVNCLRFVPQGRGWGNRHPLDLSVREQELFLDEVVHARAEGYEGMLRLGGSFETLAPALLDGPTKAKRSLHVTTSGAILLSADRGNGAAPVVHLS